MPRTSKPSPSITIDRLTPHEVICLQIVMERMSGGLNLEMQSATYLAADGSVITLESGFREVDGLKDVQLAREISKLLDNEVNAIAFDRIKRLLENPHEKYCELSIPVVKFLKPYLADYADALFEDYFAVIYVKSGKVFLVKSGEELSYVASLVKGDPITISFVEEALLKCLCEASEFLDEIPTPLPTQKQASA